MSMYEKYKGTIYDFSDRSKMRGNWFAILVIAASADESDDYAEKIVVCKQLRKMQEYFQCGECKEHFGKYLGTNPPEEEIDLPNGLLDWAIDFLNSVSERTGHELYDRKVLHTMFHNPGLMLCETQCKGGTAQGVPLGPGGTNTQKTSSYTVTSRRHNK